MNQSAVIFDFDGTLTLPCIDFDLIRSDIGIAEGPILEALARMEGAALRRAEQILERHERLASDNARLRPGAVDALDALHARGFRTGIVTRNARRWVTQVMERFGIRVDFLRTREDGAIKPSPEPVLAVCAALGAPPRQSWMVGDHLMDLISGSAAGARTVLMIGDDDKPSAAQREWMAQANHVIRRMAELPGIVLSEPRPSLSEPRP